MASWMRNMAGFSVSMDVDTVADVSTNVDTRVPSRVTEVPRQMTTTTAPLPQLATVGCCAPVLSPTLAQADVDDLAAAFKVLSDPIRLRLLNLVATADAGE